jgi:hypothetical protein
MEGHQRQLSRLSIQYRKGQDGRGKPRKVVCTVSAPVHVLQAELDIAEALVSLIEQRPAEPVVEA